MAEYVFQWEPDVTKIIIDEMKEYFVTKVKFSQLFTNFPGIRISGTHPFVHLVNEEINNVKVDTNLFPSITVVEDDEQKNPEINIPSLPSDDIRMTAAEVADIKANRDHYIITDEDLAAIEAIVETSSPLAVSKISQHRRGSFAVEIWSESYKIKTKVYGLVRNFLLGYKRFTIKSDYDIIIDEKSINGQRDGSYNFDYGKILYGATVRFPLDYEVSEFLVDTTIEDLASVNHYEEDVKNA